MAARDQKSSAGAGQLRTPFVGEYERLVDVKSRDNLLFESLGEIAPEHPKLVRRGKGQLVTDA